MDPFFIMSQNRTHIPTHPGPIFLRVTKSYKYASPPWTHFSSCHKIVHISQPTLDPFFFVSQNRTNMPAHHGPIFHHVTKSYTYPNPPWTHFSSCHKIVQICQPTMDPFFIMSQNRTHIPTHPGPIFLRVTKSYKYASPPWTHFSSCHKIVHISQPTLE